MSMLPVAVSVAAPVMVLTEGAKLSVKAVESTAQGSLLVLERASDGAQASIELSGKMLDRASVRSVGREPARSARHDPECGRHGDRLRANEIGRALLHHEPIADMPCFAATAMRNAGTDRRRSGTPITDCGAWRQWLSSPWPDWARPPRLWPGAAARPSRCAPSA
jgi:hypothetical protein